MFVQSRDASDEIYYRSTTANLSRTACSCHEGDNDICALKNRYRNQFSVVVIPFFTANRSHESMVYQNNFAKSSLDLDMLAIPTLETFERNLGAFDVNDELCAYVWSLLLWKRSLFISHVTAMADSAVQAFSGFPVFTMARLFKCGCRGGFLKCDNHIWSIRCWRGAAVLFSVECSC